MSRSLLSSVTLDWHPWARTSRCRGRPPLFCRRAPDAESDRMWEPFAVAWRGLPGSPEELAARGASIVHSVKLDGEDEEASLRARLQRVTATEAAGAQPSRVRAI